MSSIFKKMTITVGSLAALGLPVLVLAQDELVLTEGPLRAFFNSVVTVFNWILPFLVVVIAILLILWAFQFAVSAGDEEKRKAAKDKIVWGLVGLVLLMSMYGIIRIVANLVKSAGGAGVTLPIITEIPPIVQ